MPKMRGTAMEDIEPGEHVLCRQMEVRRAPPETANGIACDRPKLARRHRDVSAYKKGDFLMVDPIEGLGQRDLKAIANGPIMEPVSLYLPAGKLSEAEYQERLALDFKRAGIDPNGDAP